jgi:hypothetical protein
MFAASSPRRVFLIAFAFAVISASAFGLLARRMPTSASAETGALNFSAPPYQATIAELPPTKTEAWTPPAPQPRGPEWLYEAFTPPEIFYNPRAQQFTVRPPVSGTSDEVAEPFGLELVEVRPDPFRLQLIGYVGDEGNWRGTFENVRSGEIFLAREGRRIAELGLTIKSFEVRAQPVPIEQSMTTRQRVATAVVHDEKAKRDITLTHRERQVSDTLSALVVPAGEATVREVRQGESFSAGGAVYRVERIQQTPPQVDIMKQSPNLAQPERRVLTPRTGSADEKGGAS